MVKLEVDLTEGEARRKLDIDLRMWEEQRCKEQVRVEHNTATIE